MYVYTYCTYTYTYTHIRYNFPSRDNQSVLRLRYCSIASRSHAGLDGPTTPAAHSQVRTSVGPSTTLARGARKIHMKRKREPIGHGRWYNFPLEAGQSRKGKKLTFTSGHHLMCPLYMWYHVSGIRYHVSRIAYHGCIYLSISPWPTILRPVLCYQYQKQLGLSDDSST